MVATLSIIKTLPDELQLDSLPLKTKKAFLALRGLELFKKGGWYLAGGTGLAMQAGHRQSVDLDFFTQQNDICLLYTSDAADDLTRVDLGGRRIIKKKK